MEAFMDELKHLKIKLEDIRSATSNFDNNKVIGKGGFGKVFEGVLSHSKGQSMVAFKRLDRCFGQGDPEFLKEILMLSRCTHENLISLLGFCDEGGEKILVYEHASHGSLDRHLGATTLKWSQRLKICLMAAKGLCYLHDPKGAQQRVIHRDIKSSNILLDENWNAKVSDMGLSKMGPANQAHSFLATNVVGTFGYIDPLYMETYVLTKESDVYSFGLVLFEVLCGRLCFEYNNGHFQSLVPMWKKSYEEKKLDQIIFIEMKHHMEPRSLEAFSDIAYRCLRKSRVDRPKMSLVVEKLGIALRLQETFEDEEMTKTAVLRIPPLVYRSKKEPKMLRSKGVLVNKDKMEIFKEVEQPVGYEEMAMTALPPLVCRSKEELITLLSKGILINGGKTWFRLNKNGKHCEMISAEECLIPIRSAAPDYAFYPLQNSRFAVGYDGPYCYEFKTHVKTQFLSPHIMYRVNLVFDFDYTRRKYKHLCSYILTGKKRHLPYDSYRRVDGCLMAELYQFTAESRKVDVDITFQCDNPLAVEGIEFQPLERGSQHIEVGHEVLEDSEAYWDQKVPSNYEDIIVWSKESVQWTTKKELYSILCKGFPIRTGDEWLFLGENGKRCHMLSARMALLKEEWRWRSSPASRFGEVACDPHGSVMIHCGSNMLLPQTTYGIYLLYKIKVDISGLESMVEFTFFTKAKY